MAGSPDVLWPRRWSGSSSSLSRRPKAGRPRAVVSDPSTRARDFVGGPAQGTVAGSPDVLWPRRWSGSSSSLSRRPKAETCWGALAEPMRASASGGFGHFDSGARLRRRPGSGNGGLVRQTCCGFVEPRLRNRLGAARSSSLSRRPKANVLDLFAESSRRWRAEVAGWFRTLRLGRATSSAAGPGNGWPWPRRWSGSFVELVETSEGGDVLRGVRRACRDVRRWTPAIPPRWFVDPPDRGWFRTLRLGRATSPARPLRAWWSAFTGRRFRERWLAFVGRARLRQSCGPPSWASRLGRGGSGCGLCDRVLRQPAAVDVVVDRSDGLQRRVQRRRADEAEAPLLQILAPGD